LLKKVQCLVAILSCCLEWVVQNKSWQELCYDCGPSDSAMYELQAKVPKLAQAAIL